MAGQYIAEGMQCLFDISGYRCGKDLEQDIGITSSPPNGNNNLGMLLTIAVILLGVCVSLLRFLFRNKPAQPVADNGDDNDDGFDILFPSKITDHFPKMQMSDS